MVDASLGPPLGRLAVPPVAASQSPALRTRAAFSGADRACSPASGWGGEGQQERPRARALRQASHYRNRAYRRREVPTLDPESHATFVEPSPEQRIAARGLLDAVQGLRPELRDVLGRAALGLEMHEIARELGIPQGTVATRLRRARRLFARAITRGRKGLR